MHVYVLSLTTLGVVTHCASEKTGSEKYWIVFTQLMEGKVKPDPRSLLMPDSAVVWSASHSELPLSYQAGYMCALIY